MFLFKKRTKKIYLIETTDAGEAALPILNNLNQNEGLISKMTITNRELVDGIRKKLTDKNQHDFIKKISLQFGIEKLRYHNLQIFSN